MSDDKTHPYDRTSSVVEQIIESVKFEGFKEGTPEFGRRKTQLHVMKCQELRGLSSCTQCDAADHCSLYAQLRLDLYNRNSKP